MADPTKHGFWQTVPGMMTAIAGILSATTGMLVTLNQTGVVDLRQLAGGKTAAQSSTLETPSSALRTEDKPSRANPETEKSIGEAKRNGWDKPVVPGRYWFKAKRQFVVVE